MISQGASRLFVCKKFKSSHVFSIPMRHWGSERRENLVCRTLVSRGDVSMLDGFEHYVLHTNYLHYHLARYFQVACTHCREAESRSVKVRVVCVAHFTFMPESGVCIQSQTSNKSFCSTSIAMCFSHLALTIQHNLSMMFPSSVI